MCIQLTIAIPTYNRREYLARCTKTLLNQINDLPQGYKQAIELYISDNGSSDGTVEYLVDLQRAQKNIRLNFNESNLGPDSNISNCYDSALGEYVLVLSDDDLLLNGALIWIFEKIQSRHFGLIFLKAYSAEFYIGPPPQILSRDVVLSSDQALVGLADRLTFISSLVVRKTPGFSASSYVGTHIPQAYTAIEALNKSKNHVMSARYYIFATRANGGEVVDGVKQPMPPFGEVFVANIFNAFSCYKNYAAIKKVLASKILLRYFLYEIARRDERGEVLRRTKSACDKFMSDMFLYRILRPLMFCSFRVIRCNLLQVFGLIIRSLRGEFVKFINYAVRVRWR